MKSIITILFGILSICLQAQDGGETIWLITTEPDSIQLTSDIRTFDLSGGKVYYEETGVDTMKFTSVQPATLDPVSITFQTLAATDTVYLDWGDGSAVVKISLITDQTVTSNYSTNNTTYNIKLYGDLSKIKKFRVIEPTVASLNINDISDYMVNLDYLYLRAIKATGNKALPTKITDLTLYGGNINWTYSGALPTDITYLDLNGANINWTGLDIGNNGNITELSLINYRTEKMSSADMVTLLTQMTNRTGSLPATITINDYADYALQPQAVTDAIAALKTAKLITTVTLGQ